MSLAIINADTKPFWEGCQRSVLMLQRCSACHSYRHPPCFICQSCLSPDHEWSAASGDGTLYSFVIVHRALDSTWQGALPYIVAVVELVEGPRLTTNLVGVAVNEAQIGMPVSVVFERFSDEITVPRFRPRST